MENYKISIFAVWIYQIAHVKYRVFDALISDT